MKIAAQVAAGADWALRGVLLGVVLLWRYGLAAFFPPACRFEPSCSAYALQAIRSRGALSGGRLALWRILRCNPWGRGGYDPVPPPRPGMPSF